MNTIIAQSLSSLHLYGILPHDDNGNIYFPLDSLKNEFILMDNRYQEYGDKKITAIKRKWCTEFVDLETTIRKLGEYAKQQGLTYLYKAAEVPVMIDKDIVVNNKYIYIIFSGR